MRAERQSSGIAASPEAARSTPPRWRDVRLVTGVLLVLVSVLLGARVLGTATQGRSVLVAVRTLPAGHVIASGDLTVRSIRLSGVADRYWTGGELGTLTGRPLATGVAAGDLLARSSVSQDLPVTPTRVVSLPVDPARLPSLRLGNRVDVFATYAATSTVSGRTDVVLRGAEYLGGGDSGSGTAVSVRLRVPVDQAAAAIRASQVAKLDVALQEAAGSDAGDVGTGIGDTGGRAGAAGRG